MLHTEPHPLAGQTVQIDMRMNLSESKTVDFVVEDWADRVFGSSWMGQSGNMTAINYGFRSGLVGLPLNDEVIYGHVEGFANLIHEKELPETQTPAAVTKTEEAPPTAVDLGDISDEHAEAEAAKFTGGKFVIGVDVSDSFVAVDGGAPDFDDDDLNGYNEHERKAGRG